VFKEKEMNFFVAIIFFCANGECYFWKDNNLHYDKDKCEQVLQDAQQALNANGLENEGSCLPISTKNNV
jgi:hypothetical protein